LARLEKQIANYRKVFAKVYVVVAEPFVQEVLDSTSGEVGVMSLVRWDRIHTVREAASRPDLVCPSTIFDSLRSVEARAILEGLDVAVPVVPNTKLHAVMRELFAQLDPAAVHLAMVQTLKKTRNLAPLADLIYQLPSSLQPAALAIQVRRADHERLVRAVETPIDQAMAWA
jgi:hypothetical protein